MTRQRLPLVRWVIRAAARQRGGITLLVLLMFVEAALLAASPWPMKIIVDHVLSDTPMPAWLHRALGGLPGALTDHGIIAWMVAISVLLVAGTAGVGLVQAILSAAVGQRMVYDTAAELFAKLQRLSIGFHGRRAVGDSMRRVTGDCTCIATIVRDSLLPAVAALATVAVMFSVMLRLNLALTLIATGAVPLLLLALRYLTPPVLDRGYQYAQAEAEVWGVAERTLIAVPVIQAFCAEHRTDSVIRTTYNRVLARAQGLLWSQFHLKIAAGLVIALATAALLYIGAREVIADRLTIGGLLIFLAYLAALYAPLTGVVHAASSASQAAGGARRVLELLAETEEVTDAPGAVPIVMRRPPAVRFEHVTFSYEGDVPVLHDVELDVPPGRTIAIVGESGAGKSTLVAMLPRLIDPVRGRITIDGVDVREVTLRSLREQVAILLQDAYLFPVTIVENIAYAKPGATMQEIESAARAAGAHEFIARLPQGYMTLVGQRGATLSGGERQRLAIARALLKDAPILVLDEPTSALDAQTESALLVALDKLRQNRTTFIIAHRLSTVRGADLIVVLDRGRIVEQGTHEQLLARAGAYAHLHRLQFGEQEHR